ncbi:MAG: GTPase Era [Fimbriimonadaceae bacterium]|nr:GTPase Era [Fimbriimonadaceae bacterium]
MTTVSMLYSVNAIRMGEYHAGIVAVLGRPNVGKSTMVNTLVGNKVSIVSDKAQTTRRRALGILTKPGYQIAFLDTPGIHTPSTKLGRALNDSARSTLDDADALLVVVNVSQDPREEDRRISAMLEGAKLGDAKRSTPLILVMNKMDMLAPADVEARYKEFTDLFQPQEVIMTSMTRGDNLAELEAMIVKHLPEQAPLFDDELYTDQPMRDLASELVREQALKRLRQEVPHALATYCENWEEAEGTTTISVVLLCETEGQKAILIGRRGVMLKAIGTDARKEIEEMIGCHVYLNLFVKVKSDWRQSDRTLQELDYTK